MLLSFCTSPKGLVDEPFYPSTSPKRQRRSSLPSSSQAFSSIKRVASFGKRGPPSPPSFRRAVSIKASISGPKDFKHVSHVDESVAPTVTAGCAILGLNLKDLHPLDADGHNNAQYERITSSRVPSIEEESSEDAAMSNQGNSDLIQATVVNTMARTLETEIEGMATPPLSCSPGSSFSSSILTETSPSPLHSPPAAAIGALPPISSTSPTNTNMNMDTITPPPSRAELVKARRASMARRKPVPVYDEITGETLFPISALPSSITSNSIFVLDEETGPRGSVGLVNDRESGLCIAIST